MHDMLEGTRAYQELIKDSREKALLEGLERGRQEAQQKALLEGLERGRQEAQQEKLLETRETVLDMILELHPQLRIPAQELIDSISDPRVLRHIIVKIPTLKTPEDILQYLRSMKG